MSTVHHSATVASYIIDLSLKVCTWPIVSDVWRCRKMLTLICHLSPGIRFSTSFCLSIRVLIFPKMWLMVKSHLQQLGTFRKCIYFSNLDYFKSHAWNGAQNIVLKWPARRCWYKLMFRNYCGWCSVVSTLMNTELKTIFSHLKFASLLFLMYLLLKILWMLCDLRNQFQI